MARSIKKNNAGGGTTAKSDKLGKRRANRTLRSRVRNAIKCELEIIPKLREVSDIWNFPKDGKIYYSTKNPKNLRK